MEGEDADVDPEVGEEVGPGTTDEQRSVKLRSADSLHTGSRVQARRGSCMGDQLGFTRGNREKLTSWVNCEWCSLCGSTSTVTESEADGGAWTENLKGLGVSK